MEILLRSRTKVPPNFQVAVDSREPSDVPGFDTVNVVITSDTGQKFKAIPFLLSTDGKTMAQFSKFDISKDPRELVSAAGRPTRGGTSSAPVQIVVFDDLECPYCAKMHEQLFPAMLQRYGDKVSVVYKDFPISQHPWAMRAAVDVNCLAAQNGAAYWNDIDYVHAHAGEYGGPEHSLTKANDSLDQLALDEAKKQNLNTPELQACIKKQDETAIRASMTLGEKLEVDATPVLFINGEKLEGAYPIEDVYRMIDGALVAAGKTPPSPYVPATPTTAPQAPAAAAKPAS
jgi:protein-disulfide isomerase